MCSQKKPVSLLVTLPTVKETLIQTLKIKLQKKRKRSVRMKTSMRAWLWKTNKSWPNWRKS